MLIVFPGRKVLFFVFLMTPLFVKGFINDTIPPLIVDFPDGISINCEIDYFPVFEAWYNDFAGTEVFESSGVFTIFATYTLNEADSLLQLSSDTICDNAAFLSLGFYALDSCLNSSDTLYAGFEIFDDEKPVILKAAEAVSFNCDFGIRDSLENWLDTHGGAIATDNCGDSVIWSNYFWSDSQGNSGFVELGDTSNIIIQRSVCDWFVNVSFFVIDPCGNANVSNGSFTLSGDDAPPLLITPLPNVTIECSNLPYTDEPIFEDGCDGLIDLTLMEESTQDPDSTICEHYNYRITRTWIATDVCGNSAATLHVIDVQDTEAPVVNFNNLVLVDCDKDVINDLEGIIDVEDACGIYIVDFNDVVVSSSLCQQEYDRAYTVSDACGNSFNFSQAVQIQDLSAPEFSAQAVAESYFCDGQNDILSLFDSWIENNGGAEATDNCNVVTSYARLPGSYSISNIQTIVTADQASIDLDNCLRNNEREIVRLEVDFIFIDQCNNISISSASFTVTDTIAPIISTCNEDINITLKSNRCDTILPLPVPDADDICGLYDKRFLEYSVILNNGLRVDYLNSITENLSFDVGVHQLEYLVFDCAGNVASCFQTITITEEVPPILNCPNDQTIVAPAGSCSAELLLPETYTIDENCKTTFTFEETQPTGAGYISFFYNQDLDTFVANSVFLGYMNLEIFGSLSDPSLELFFAGDTDSNDEFFILYSESGAIIETVQFSDARCNNTSSIIIDLDENDFLEWAENGTIFFTLGPDDENGDGINPCVEITQNGTDEISFLRATLRFNDVFPEVEIRDIQDKIIPIDNFSDTLDLDVGIYQVEYTIADASGNRDSCEFSLFIVDKEAPSVSCMINDTLFIEPSLFGLSFYEDDFFNIDVSDNCGILEYRFSPESVDCALFGQPVDVTIEVEDFFGNISDCTTPIVSAAMPLNIDFSSGLCIDDTIQLLSNIELNDVFNVLRYNWTGPNGFVSFEKDPQLEITNLNLSGLYQLELTDAIGCMFFGEVNIEIQALNSPEIFANANGICEGETLLLNSTSFTESVNYLWYEGVSPNGVLLVITGGPSVQLNPTPGTHFYYVDIEGEDCNTNESTTIQIEVEPTPIAEVKEPFVTICEGDNIVLSAETAPDGSIYNWIGPAGYESTGQFPQVISDASGINDGSYALVVSKNDCTSDTAFTQVVVFSQPLKPIISGDHVFCEESNFILSVNNVQTADQYQWFLNGVLMSSLSSNNLIIPVAQNSLAGEWTVIVQDGLCFSEASQIFEVSISPKINIGANNNGPICKGDSVQLSSSFIPDADYLWSTPSGAFLNGRNQNILAQEGIYNLTVTTSSNCSNVASTIVEILEVPRITALSNSSLICMDKENSIFLVPTVFPPGNYSYIWTGPNGYNSDQESPVIKNADEDDNGIYTLQISDGNCISESKTTSINISVIPDPPELFLSSTSCEGDSLIFQVFTTLLDVQYYWNTPKGVFQNSNSSFKISNADVGDNGLYSVRVGRGACISKPSNTIIIDLTLQVKKPIINANNNLCEGEDLILSVGFVDDAEYIWFGPDGLINQNTDEVIIQNVSLDQEGSYQVIRIVNQCLSDTSIAYQVNINQIPEAPVFEQDTIELCFEVGQQVEICLIDTPIDNQVFQLVDIQQDTIVSTSASNCFILDNLSLYQMDEIVFTVRRRLNGCISEDSEIIRIIKYETPETPASFIIDSVFVCGELEVRINIDNPLNYDLSFTLSDPELIIESVDDYIMISNFSELSSEIQMTSSFRLCENFGMDLLSIFVGSDIVANDDEISMDYNSIVDLDVLGNDIFQNIVNFEIIDFDGIDNINLVNEILHIESDNTTTGIAEVIYEICVENCPTLCDMATITINIGDGEDCFVGNLITPNNDGINDRLIVPCLGSGLYPENEILIFNQWGGEVFKASPYLNDWDAIYKGNPLATGTYYYQLTLSDAKEVLSGFIVVER